MTIAYPNILVDKTVSKIIDNDGGGLTSVGDQIEYSVVIGAAAGQTGTWSYDVKLYDSLLGTYLAGANSTVSGDADNDGKLENGETWTVKYTYTLTQNDLDPAKNPDCDVDNVVTATFNGLFNCYPSCFEKCDSTSTPILKACPDIDVEKHIKVGGTVYGDQAGEAWPTVAAGTDIQYQFVIDNPGNVTLDVILSDNVLGTIIAANYNTGGSLPAGYTLTGDADNDRLLDTNETWTVAYSTKAGTTVGKHANTATATGTDANGKSDTDTDSAEYTVANPCPPVPCPTPAIDVEKTAKYNDNGNKYADTADTITYTYVVNNGASTLPLTNVVLTDDGGPAADSFTVTNRVFTVGDTDEILEDGEIWTYTKSVNVTEAMIKHLGTSYVNEVTATGKYGNTTVTDKDTASVELIDKPCEPGTAMTPGFWKNKGAVDTDGVNGPMESVFHQETGFHLSTQYEVAFQLNDGAVGTARIDGNKTSADPTLHEALKAQGGGEGAFLRASTAALANASSDDLHYSFCEDEMMFSAAIRDVLNKADLNDDKELSASEIINLVQDVYNDSAADTNLFNKIHFGAVASALDAMNNMGGAEYSDFFA